MNEVQEICRIDNYWNDSTPGSGIKSGAEEEGQAGWEIMYVRLRGTASKAQ